MIKRLAALLLFLHFSVAYSQTIKTDVLVIGGTPSGVAAAIQCARSKVKTVLIESQGRLCPQLVNEDLPIPAGGGVQSGIWMELIKKVIEYQDKLPGAKPHLLSQFNSGVAANVLTQIADTVKNLAIDTNTKFVSIKKDGDRWEVAISTDGKTQIIKPRVVIDATENGEVMIKAGGKWNLGDLLDMNYETNSYRTSISMGDARPVIKSDMLEPRSGYYVPIKALIAKGIDNMIIAGLQWPEQIEGEPKISKALATLYFHSDISLGQGAGVTAAYCAFFKTTTANLNVRAIQVELLDFKGYLLPFADISTDPYWRAIQQVCATGMLKGKQKMIDGRQQFLFMPDSIVTTAEIKPVLTEIYTRAFLWFNREKPGKEFTIGNLLSFISEITLTEPDNLQRKIEKEWSAQYKFKSAFDMDRPITRREFAILTNKYLNPFARTVDLDGRIVN